ncbi:MAG: hypothetical protein JKY54_09145 [Flavobacteriales bacterium]|nr:hypothetical protein [Flavobacteriales bacterium]
MDSLTEEELKWFKSLERVLKRMPESVEILVQEQFNSPKYLSSEIHLMRKGVIHQSQEVVGDLMAYDPSSYSLINTTFNKVAANNHGY